MRGIVKRWSLAEGFGKDYRRCVTLIVGIDVPITDPTFQLFGAMEERALGDPALRLAGRLAREPGPVVLEIGEVVSIDPASMSDDELGETARRCAEEIGRRMIG